MKHRLRVLLLTLVTLFTLTAFASAAEGTCGDNLTWNFDEATATLTISGTGKMTQYEVYPWAPYAEDLTALVVEEGVAVLGDYAFAGCTALKTVQLPSTLLDIGRATFSNCASLTAITVPDKVELIDNSAFDHCTALRTVILPEGLVAIDADAFSSCTSLTEVHLPATLEYISDRAFYSCIALETVFFNGTEADRAALDIDEGNDPLVNAVWVCADAVRLNGTCGENVTWAYDASFHTLIIYGSGAMGENGNPWASFKTDITALVVDEGITAIDSSAFAGCTALTTIHYLPQTLTSIGFAAFDHCTSLTAVTIPASVTAIGDYAFYDCDSLTAITVPAGVTGIGYGAFSGCDSLTSLTLEEGNTAYKMVDNALLTADGTTLLAALVGKDGTFTVPAGVTTVMNETFYQCADLTSLIIPEGVTSIGSGAFTACRNLTEVTLPKTLTSIGSTAFYACDSLTTVHYAGSEADREKMHINSLRNDPLLDAAWICADAPDTPSAPTVGSIRYSAPDANVTIYDGIYTNDGNVTVFTPSKQGTYTLTAKKAGCLTYTVKDITVGSEDIDLGELKMLAGDLNADDKINMSDLRTFLNNFNKTGANISEPLADFDGNSKVNMSDLRVFLANFNKTAEKDCTHYWGV